MLANLAIGISHVGELWLTGVKHPQVAPQLVAALGPALAVAVALLFVTGARS